MDMSALWIDSDARLLRNPVDVIPTVYETEVTDDAAIAGRRESDSVNLCSCLIYVTPTERSASLL